MTSGTRILKALVFSGRGSLDFSELRTNVLRIPEVTIRIREAQAILDTIDLPRIDFFNLVSSDNDHFLRQLKLRSLATDVVQIGLFDRYVKNQRRPDFMVGRCGPDTSMLVCAGLLSFENMVRGSQVSDLSKPQNVISFSASSSAPFLGNSFADFHAFEAVQTATGLTYVAFGESAVELKRIVSSLHSERGVERFIGIGPASALPQSEYKEISEDIEALDSIELDPMLGWFWRSVQSTSVAEAQ